MASAYDVPSWAGKPPPGIHLDISKDDKFIQKIMIDEKKVIFFIKIQIQKLNFIFVSVTFLEEIQR